MKSDMAYRYVLRFKTIVLSMLLLSPNLIHAANDSINVFNTLWVVGSKDTIANALMNVSFIFSSIGSGGFYSGLIFAALTFSVFMMSLTVLTDRPISALSFIIALITFLALFVPTTSVYVASGFGNDNNSNYGAVNGGAVSFAKIDNIPIGVVYPVALISTIFKTMTEKYDTVLTVTPPSNINLGEGGLSIYGLNGYFSPLKAILNLRSMYHSPSADFVVNLQKGRQNCNWGNDWEYSKNGGLRAVLARDNQTGITEMLVGYQDENKGFHTILDAEKNTGKMKPVFAESVSCQAMGAILVEQMLLSVLPDPKDGLSDIARETTNIAEEIGSANKQNLNAQIQAERNSIPKLLAESVAGNASYSSKSSKRGQLNQILNELYNGRENGAINRLTQSYAAQQTVEAAEIEANMIYANMVSECLSNDKNCQLATYTITNAANRVIVDSAGESSLVQGFMIPTMNFLMYLYITLSPLIILIILSIGSMAWRLVKYYLIFAVWINSWLPIMNAIVYFSQMTYIDRISKMGYYLAMNQDSTRILSPIFLNEFIKQTMYTLGSAASYMSSVPLIALFILTGSIYGMVSLANKSLAADKGAFDETAVSPNLHNSSAVNKDSVIAANRESGIMRSDFMAQSDGQLDNDRVIALSTSTKGSEAYVEGIDNTTTDSQQQQTSTAQTNAITTQNGTTILKNKTISDGTNQNKGTANLNESAKTSQDSHSTRKEKSHDIGAEEAITGKVGGGIKTPFFNASVEASATGYNKNNLRTATDDTKSETNSNKAAEIKSNSTDNYNKLDNSDITSTINSTLATNSTTKTATNTTAINHANSEKFGYARGVSQDGTISETMAVKMGELNRATYTSLLTDNGTQIQSTADRHGNGEQIREILNSSDSNVDKAKAINNIMYDDVSSNSGVARAADMMGTTASVMRDVDGINSSKWEQVENMAHKAQVISNQMELTKNLAEPNLTKLNEFKNPPPQILDNKKKNNNNATRENKI